MLRFGKKWIQINDNIYYRSEAEINALKTWYISPKTFSMTEETMEDLMDFFMKAFTLLDPKDCEEALAYIEKLEELYKTPAKEIIEKIYSNLFGRNC